MYKHNGAILDVFCLHVFFIAKYRKVTQTWINWFLFNLDIGEVDGRQLIPLDAFFLRLIIRIHIVIHHYLFYWLHFKQDIIFVTIVLFLDLCFEIYINTIVFKSPYPGGTRGQSICILHKDILCYVTKGQKTARPNMILYNYLMHS